MATVTRIPISITLNGNSFTATLSTGGGAVPVNVLLDTGSSLTAVNLALTAARDGREVALVECDLRKPSLARLLDLAPRGGLAEVVDGKVELAQALSRLHRDLLAGLAPIPRS